MTRTQAMGLWALFLVIFVFILARAIDQNQAEHSPAVPAAVNSVAPDDEGAARMSPLDFTTDTLPLSTEG